MEVKKHIIQQAHQKKALYKEGEIQRQKSHSLCSLESLGVYEGSSSLNLLSATLNPKTRRMRGPQFGINTPDPELAELVHHQDSLTRRKNKKRKEKNPAKVFSQVGR